MILMIYLINLVAVANAFLAEIAYKAHFSKVSPAAPHLELDGLTREG